MLDRSRWWAWGGVFSAWLALAALTPVVGCKDDKAGKDDGEKKKKDKDESDDDDKPKKKKAKAEDDDDDDKSKKKKAKGDDDDDKPKKKADDDEATKKADSDAGGDDKTVPKTGTAAPTASATGESFAGSYSSNWGKSTFTQTGETVNVVYPRGTMSCTAKDKTLYCRWKEGSAVGGAVLTKQPNGTISGTWGNGASTSNGGPWVFTKS